MKNRGREALLVGGVAFILSASMSVAPAVSASPTSTAATGIEQRSSVPLQRPALQALSQYRSGNTTVVRIASILPIQGAVSYRLERFDQARGIWIFDGLCERLCIRTLDNATVRVPVSYRMRAVDAAGKMSLPSVSLGVSPHVWNPKKHPGSTLEFRLGNGSAGVVAKAYETALLSLVAPCVLDAALRLALSKAVDLHYARAARLPNAATVVSALAATFTHEIYNAVYDGKCDLISGMASSILVALNQVRTSGTAVLGVNSYWAGQHSSSLPDFWICHINLSPKGRGVKDFYRVDTMEKPCLDFAVSMWTVAG
jgi:hypothetical protein